ncbi:hypothetical protein SCP_0800600 [Sparassis crispa]|uniref:Uncharacterized protein n=1 Tax=Sparassis crispa TaxID=139825 RepID=A0A401GTN9_9APHY|nr:hypothetical protein SCP_0800600 [Sparassis crispa]GBE85543.1 hypothetical protein SCP_0800600 [Sparassis crispa]
MLVAQDGSLLLSAGDDAVLKIWSLRSGEQWQEIFCTFHGPIGAIAWVDLGGGLDRAFVFGCGDGSIHLYVRDDATDVFLFRSLVCAHKGYVEDIRFDPSHGRLVTIGQGAVQVWRFESEGSISAVWATKPRKDYMA